MAIALLTDFGRADYFTGAVKGSILSIDPNAAIVDITHEIAAHDIRAASFILGACFEDFPADTVFMCVVDPGVGSARRAIAAAVGNRCLVAPDNGLLTDVLSGAEFSAVELTNRRYFGARESSTFHGRDIFGPVAAYISLGVPLMELGPQADQLVFLDAEGPTRLGGAISGEIIHIDRFGNLVTNFRRQDIPTTFWLDICGLQVRTLSTAYTEMPRGELFLIEGSAGYIEVSLRESSAALLTGAPVGQKIVVHRDMAE